MHNLLCVQGNETSIYISWQQQMSPQYDKCIWQTEEIAIVAYMIFLPAELRRFW